MASFLHNKGFQKVNLTEKKIIVTEQANPVPVHRKTFFKRGDKVIIIRKGNYKGYIGTVKSLDSGKLDDIELILDANGSHIYIDCQRLILYNEYLSLKNILIPPIENESAEHNSTDINPIDF